MNTDDDDDSNINGSESQATTGVDAGTHDDGDDIDGIVFFAGVNLGQDYRKLAEDCHRGASCFADDDSDHAHNGYDGSDERSSYDAEEEDNDAAADDDDDDRDIGDEMSTN